MWKGTQKCHIWKHHYHHHNHLISRCTTINVQLVRWPCITAWERDSDKKSSRNKSCWVLLSVILNFHNFILPLKLHIKVCPAYSIDQFVVEYELPGTESNTYQIYSMVLCCSSGVLVKLAGMHLHLKIVIYKKSRRWPEKHDENDYYSQESGR